jgi:tRNA-dihydrouridine synthase
VQLVTVHGRTRQQFYKGRADWSAIRAVRDAITIPLIANGDCESVSDARAMLMASGADGVMIGRAALGRPWLIGEIAHGLDPDQVAAPSMKARGEAAREHLETLVDLMGERAGLRHARKHLAAYVDHSGGQHPARAADRMRLVTTDDLLEAKSLLAAFFAEAERDGLDPHAAAA